MLLLLPYLSLSLINIVPRPYHTSQVSGKVWTITKGMQIGYDPAISSYAKEIAEFFSDAIYTPTGIRFEVVESAKVKLGIQLSGSVDDKYRINMDSDLIQISANTQELLFDAMQTILQILPPQIYSNKTITDPSISWQAPCVTIEDYPRFQWRGVMIDVCRHFFDVTTIKSIIDSMSHFKLNVLHFHITEDQGWRLELPNFPNLTLYGSKRDASPVMWDRNKLDGIPYGPFYYSEGEIKEIIEYGKKRFVKIIPEIEMPGHALSLLSGYPQYSCTGGPFKPRCYWGVEDDIICAGNDQAIEFLEKILDDVLEIFDSVFIHCGGDECPRSRWKKCPKCQKRIKDEGLSSESQLQQWFTQHFSKYLESKGRRMIGWDEILDGDLPFPDSTVVMSWQGVSGGLKAAKLGHDVVMTPDTYLYLDFYQFAALEPYEYIRGLDTAYNIYSYNPTSGLDEQYHKYIIGVQGNLWTEYVWEREDLEWKLFPRILAVAEIGWTQNEVKNWPRFLSNYAVHQKEVLKNMAVVDAGFQLGTIGQWKSGELKSDKWVSVEFPLDGCLNQKGTVEAAFVYTGGNDCHVKNVKFLFDGAVVGHDDHEGVVSEEAKDSTYKFVTDKKPSGKISIQAEMMCKDGENCEGVIYVYCLKIANDEKVKVQRRNYDY